MTDTANTNPSRDDSAKNAAGTAAPPPAQTQETDEAALRESLKRCPPATVEAALAFRATRDPAFVPAIVIGIVERFVEPDLRPKLKGGADEVRLIDDLGIDSLTMMEIVILVEEVLQVQINNDELRNLRSIGDVKVFIDCKLRGVPPPAPARFLPVEQIAAVMPMQPPFLFLNEATVGGAGAEGKYKITGGEFFLQGHFKDNPVMPASMLLEALGQLAVLALIEGIIPSGDGGAVDPATIYFTSCEGVRCHRICRPGDLLSLSVKPKRAKMPLATFEGQIRVGQEKAVVVEEITLAFGYAGAPAAAGASPAENTTAAAPEATDSAAAAPANG
jgi:3-hydroxyacyl-[acyl-carrier-protein] dehydratase